MKLICQSINILEVDLVNKNNKFYYLNFLFQLKILVNNIKHVNIKSKAPMRKTCRIIIINSVWFCLNKIVKANIIGFLVGLGQYLWGIWACFVSFCLCGICEYTGCVLVCSSG